LHPELGVLRRHDDERRLTGQALHVLLVLLDAGDSAVSRDALLDQVWGENYPADSVVSRAIADIRSALGESANERTYIDTLPKFGYRLVAECGPVAAPADEESPARRNVRTATQVVTVLFAMAMIIAAFFWLQRPQVNSPATLVRLPPERPLTSSPGLEHQPRVLPGGEWVVYAALRPGQRDWDLFRVSMTDGVSQAVAALPGIQEHGPAPSPLGNELAYVRVMGGKCDVVTQSLVFGVPERISGCTTKFLTLVDWSPEGRWIAYTGSEDDDPDGYRRIYAIERITGERRQITDAVSPTGTDFYPRFSPSGRQVAFLRGEPQPDHRTSLWYAQMQGGIETRVTAQPAQLGGMTWLDDSTLLYSVNEAGRFEIRQKNVLTGEARRIETSRLIHPDYLAEEALLVAAARRSERDLLVVASDQSPSALASSTSDDHHGAFSPDESIAAFISRRSGYDELWIIDIEHEVTRRLTRFDGATVRYPAWHPDGKKILFTVQTDAGERLYEVDVISGDLRQPGAADIESTMPKWLNDGQRWVHGCRDKNRWGVCLSGSDGTERLAEGYYRPTPLSNDSIAAVDDSGMLYTISLSDGRAEPIWDGLPNEGRSGWAIDERHLVYNAPSTRADSTRVIRRDMSSGAEMVLYEGAMPLVDTAISIGNVTGAVLLTRYQAASDDLVIIRHDFGQN
jgi:Tol biopolymer transport system component/DNA-binding winged helix-turn-helix (wHTH) protein